MFTNATPHRTAFGDAPVCVVCHYLLFWIGRARSGARSRVCEMWLKCDSSSSGGSNCVHPTLIPSLSLPCIDARPTHALNPTQARFSMSYYVDAIVTHYHGIPQKLNPNVASEMQHISCEILGPRYIHSTAQAAPSLILSVPFSMLCLTRGALNGSVLANMSWLIFDGNNFPTDLKS